MAELTDPQYERLITMLAENRVAVSDLHTALTLAEREWQSKLDQILAGLKLQGSALAAIEEDLTEIQKEMREMKETVGQHAQSLDGITQLTMTNYDLLETLTKHVHGESESIRHDQQREQAK